MVSDSDTRMTEPLDSYDDDVFVASLEDPAKKYEHLAKRAPSAPAGKMLAAMPEEEPKPSFIGSKLMWFSLLWCVVVIIIIVVVVVVVCPGCQDTAEAAATEVPTLPPGTEANITENATMAPSMMIPSDNMTEVPVNMTESPTESPLVIPGTLPPISLTLSPTTVATTSAPTSVATTVSPTSTPTSVATTVSPTSTPTSVATTVSPTSAPTSVGTTESPTSSATVATAAPTTGTTAPTGTPTVAATVATTQAVTTQVPTVGGTQAPATGPTLPPLPQFPVAQPTLPPLPALPPALSSGPPTNPILELLPEYSLEALNDQLSPQARAYLFLGFDPNIATRTPEELVQRFALATLYFGLGRAWTSGAANPATDECTWFSETGSECNADGEMIRLLLSNNNLEGGPIPPEIGLLTALEELDLSSNFIDSTIPTYLGQLTELQSLSLANNPLIAGTIPEELANITTLQSIDLTGLDLVTGVIPEALCGLDLSFDCQPAGGPCGCDSCTCSA